MVRNIGDDFRNNTKIAIVTFLVDAPEDAYHPFTDYERLYPLTVKSLQKYADKHLYCLKISRHAAETGKQAYWNKMDLIRSTLDEGYDWVLYTDIDVLIVDHETPLQHFMVNRDIITASECAIKGRSMTSHLPRSGFLLFRNSPRTYEFLDVWTKSFEFYEMVQNPEQSALETLHDSMAWKNDIYLHDWGLFHSYDTCDFAFNSFSVHFPGKYKVSRVARAWFHFSMQQGQSRYAWAKDEELSDYAGKLLQEHFQDYAKEALHPDFAPEARERVEVEQCLQETLNYGYRVDTTYDAVFHAYVKYYLILSYLTNLPTTIYLTLAGKNNIPKEISDNIRTWQILNPRHQVILHDDQDISALVRRVIPDLYGVWPDLLKVTSSMNEFASSRHARSLRVCAQIFWFVREYVSIDTSHAFWFAAL